MIYNVDLTFRFRILPRMLRNVSKRDISTTVLGEKVSMPVGVSPTGFQKFAHIPMANAAMPEVNRSLDTNKKKKIISCKYSRYKSHNFSRRSRRNSFRSFLLLN